MQRHALEAVPHFIAHAPATQWHAIIAAEDWRATVTAAGTMARHRHRRH